VQCFEKTPAENAGPQLEAVNRWAGALRKTGRLTEAEKLYRKLLQAYEGTGPALEVDAATVAHNLANALVDSGRFSEARGLYERALSLLANHWPTEDEAQRLAGIMGQNYQHCLVALGFPEKEALAQTRRLLKLPSSTKGR
jgi:tetratricopeptide (TPR) repeat protein